MEITLYFKDKDTNEYSVERIAQMRRNTARLRLDWQQLLIDQAKENRDTISKIASWQSRAKTLENELAGLNENDDTNRLATGRKETIKLNEEMTILNAEATKILISQELIQARLLIDSGGLSLPEFEEFDKKGGSFWLQQDYLECQKVIAFFRDSLGGGGR